MVTSTQKPDYTCEKLQAAACPKTTGLPREVVKWLRSLDLTLYPKNVRRDFSSGYLVAEIFSRYYPQDFPEHSYDKGTSLSAKQKNWSRMERSLQKQNLHLTKEAVDGTVHCKPGAAELLVQEVYEILTNRSVRDAERPGLDFTDREYQERLPTLARPTASTAIKSNLATTETMAEPDVSTNRRKAEVILRRHLEDRAAERALHPGRFKVEPPLGRLAAK
ncbi:spermatogenesis-associated protein 4 isoform X2 [Scophthalmus maximus]|uniref:spermatogenesis-associated protein 4 isoform X2 n=1 Tax=Scophthalmus maximus TaxID=52904 RepID=UPI0015E072EB|nr:spermatogenesis-associated protein 4 isoform X2 [Scophthalmus maximus]